MLNLLRNYCLVYLYIFCACACSVPHNSIPDTSPPTRSIPDKSLPDSKKTELIDKTAIIGWGSLVWTLTNKNTNRRLDVTGNEWKSRSEQGENPAFKDGGPELFIEFSSYANDGRVTLVLDPENGHDVKTFFALSNKDTLNKAIEDLSWREGCKGSARCIAYTRKNSDGHYETFVNQAWKQEWKDLIHNKMAAWLTTNENRFEGIRITSVIWTDLPRKFVVQGAKGVGEILAAAKQFVSKKPKEAQEKALLYLKNAPVTPYTRIGPPLEKFLEELISP